MNTITVTVSGSSGTGKSTIAELISQALAKEGLDVVIVDDNGFGTFDELPGSVANTLSERVESIIRKDVDVTVQTQSVFRSSTTGD